MMDLIVGMPPVNLYFARLVNVRLSIFLKMFGGSRRREMDILSNAEIGIFSFADTYNLVTSSPYHRNRVLHHFDGLLHGLT